MEATRRLSKRPIWRKHSQCKFFNKAERAKVRKPYPACWPSFRRKCADFYQELVNQKRIDNRCTMQLRDSKLVELVLKHKKRRLKMRAQNPPAKTTKKLPVKAKRGTTGVFLKGETDNDSYEEHSQPVKVLQQIAEPKCGMCLRPQVPVFCHIIPGCPSADLLCAMCYPRLLTTWAQRSDDLTKSVPCPVCRKGEVKWNQALEPFKNDYAIAASLQKK